MELNRVADFFEIMNIKQTYPKVQMSLLGNFHQAKTIHVIEDEPSNQFSQEFNQAQEQVVAGSSQDNSP